MIIFGTTGITTTPDRGQFFCPDCGPATPYAHKKVRRFFTLYFIPCIPLDLIGEYVECGRCCGTFQPKVLDFDPAAEEAQFKAEFHYAVSKVMVLMMLADGAVDVAEIRTIRETYEKLTGTPITDTDVYLEAERAKADGLQLDHYLRGVVGSLNEHGKELVLTSAFMVAAADGHIDETETKLMHRIAELLQMSRAHCRELINELMAEAQMPIA